MLEDWDLDELETQLRQIWPVGDRRRQVAPEAVDREQLKDDLDEDAMAAYDEREDKLGEELMRHLERSILLQVIDNRWREHLFDMDYLREGIHLRGFAQIDPLVAYKNEGFTMFEELMHSIWEEFSKLVFHAEIEYTEAGRQQPYEGGGFEAGSRPAARSTTRAAPRRRSPRRSNRWRPGSARAPRPGGAVDMAASRAVGPTAAATWSRPWSKTSTTKSAATTPVGAAAGKKYKKCHGA